MNKRNSSLRGPVPRKEPLLKLHRINNSTLGSPFALGMFVSKDSQLFGSFIADEATFRVICDKQG